MWNLLLPYCGFKVNVVHRCCDTGTTSVPLSCKHERKYWEFIVFKQVHLSSNTREVPAIISFWRDQKTWSKKTAVLNSNIKACWAVTNHHLCFSQWYKSSATFTAVMLLPFMSKTWFNSILWFWCLALSVPYLLTPWSTSVIRLNNICSAGPSAPTCLVYDGLISIFQIIILLIHFKDRNHSPTDFSICDVSGLVVQAYGVCGCAHES